MKFNITAKMQNKEALFEYVKETYPDANPWGDYIETGSITTIEELHAFLSTAGKILVNGIAKGVCVSPILCPCTEDEFELRFEEA